MIPLIGHAIFTDQDYSILGFDGLVYTISKLILFMKKLIILLLSVVTISVTALDGYSAAQNLAASGIISQKSTQADYRLDDNVLRQEVIGTAVKLQGIELPDSYRCLNMFDDVSATDPNTWACRAIELAADSGLISKSNSVARPEETITRSEALAIVMATKDFPDGNESQPVDARANDWQSRLLQRALMSGIIDDAIDFDPNGLALRGDVFIWADLVMEYEAPEKEMISGEVGL